jgi:hypothetical protein
MPAEARWYWNDGGPLLVLPCEHAGAWEGTDPPTGARVVPARSRWAAPDAPATDYDRACDVGEFMALLELEGTWGLVLSSEVAQAAAWLPDEANADVAYLFAVANLDGDSDGALREILETLSPESWQILSRTLPVERSGLLLLHAADRGDDVRVWPARTPEVPERGAVIGEGLAQPLRAGRYELAGVEVHTAAGDYLAIARFTLQEAAA